MQQISQSLSRSSLKQCSRKPSHRKWYVPLLPAIHAISAAAGIQTIQGGKSSQMWTATTDLEASLSLAGGETFFFFPRERLPITYISSKTRLNVRQMLIPVFLYAVHRCNFNIRLYGIIIKFTQPDLRDLKTYILRTRAPRSKEWEWNRAEYLCIKVISVSNWENRTVNAHVPWQLSNYVDHTRPSVCWRSNQ